MCLQRPRNRAGILIDFLSQRHGNAAASSRRLPLTSKPEQSVELFVAVIKPDVLMKDPKCGGHTSDGAASWTRAELHPPSVSVSHSQTELNVFDRL